MPAFVRPGRTTARRWRFTVSRQDGAVKRPLEDCLKGAELAFKDELIADLGQDVIRTERKPDGIWREAKRRLKLLRATADLSTEDAALARSYWWLAKFKRDYPDEFYTKIQETEKKEMTEEKKHLDEKKFDFVIIPCNVREIIHHASYDPGGAVPLGSIILKFAYASDLGVTISHILRQVYNNYDLIGESRKEFERALFLLLEEKFGLKVRTCGNCMYFKAYEGISALHYCEKSSAKPPDAIVRSGDTCVNNMLHGVMNCWKPQRSFQVIFNGHRRCPFYMFAQR